MRTPIRLVSLPGCLLVSGLALGVAACSPDVESSAPATTSASVAAGTADGAVAVQPVQESGDDGAVDGVGDQVRVVGSGIATAVPDVLEAELSTQVTRPSVDEALAVSSERTAAVLEALVGAGVPEEDNQPRNVGVSPKRSRNSDGPREITGYRATNSLSVRVADLDTADHGVASGVTPPFVRRRPRGRVRTGPGASTKPGARPSRVQTRPAGICALVPT